MGGMDWIDLALLEVWFVELVNILCWFMWLRFQCKISGSHKLCCWGIRPSELWHYVTSQVILRHIKEIQCLQLLQSGSPRKKWLSLLFFLSLWMAWNLKIQVLLSFETLETTHPVTWCYIPNDLNSAVICPCIV